MLKNYLVSALRSILNSRFYTVVNILCLSIGIMGVYFAYILLLNLNNSKIGGKNQDRIFLLNNHYQLTDSNVSGKHTPGSLARELQQKYPSIELSARVAAIKNTEIQNLFNNTQIITTGCYSENSLFEIFDLKCINAVNKEYLSSSNSIVISRKLSEKLFAQANVLNNTIQIDGKIYEVKAVMDEIVLGFGITFDFVLPVDNYIASNPDLMSSNAFLSYILLRTSEEYKNVSSLLANERFHDDNLNTDMNLSLQPFNDSGEPFKESVLLLSIGAIILLLISLINFINLSNARLSLRYKEIGVRKVNGSSRIQIFFQYITETLTLTFISALLAMMLTFLFIPQVKSIYSPFINDAISFNILNFNTILLLVCILISIGILAGIYPAAILSSFNPIRILKAGFNSPVRGILFRRLFILGQYIPTVIVILFGFTLYSKFHDPYIAKRINVSDDIYVLEMKGNIIPSEIQKEINDLPQVTKLTAASVIPTLVDENALFRTKKDNSGLILIGSFLSVNHSYFDFFNIKLVSGFIPLESNSNKILINEALANKLDAEGSLIDNIIVNKEHYFIAGVFKDPIDTEYAKNSKPVAINVTDQKLPYLFIQSNLKQSVLLTTIGAILKDNKESLYKVERLIEIQSKAEQFNFQVSKVIIGFSILMLFIAGMGVLSLSSILAVKKTLEAGIRKVNGAKTSDIFKHQIKEFIVLSFISLLIGITLVYLILPTTLRLEVKTIFFTIFLTIMTTFLASVFQSISLAIRNPSDIFRYE